MKKKSIIIAIIVFLFDQLIKTIVNKSLYYGALKSIIPNLFYLTKVYNQGAAWSIMEGSRVFLVVISIICLVCLFIYEGKFKTDRKVSFAFGLIYGGLIGNLIDRIRLGYVIDYLEFYIIKYEFPVFNLADTALVIGFLILIISIIKGSDKNDY